MIPRTTSLLLLYLFLSLLLVLDLCLVLTPPRVRFIWFLIAGLGDGVSAFFGALHTLRLWADAKPDTRRFLLFQLGALGAILLDSSSTLLAQALWPPACSGYTIAHNLIFWNGNFAKTFAILVMVLYQMGIINGVGAKSTAGSGVPDGGGVR